ncbi:peptidase S24/S26A/S26B/S26C [Entophlyctis helioformis]|nr:peptidase S24/S26A/S26B/S26C [Entophlyctis helioformis]
MPAAQPTPQPHTQHTQHTQHCQSAHAGAARTSAWRPTPQALRRLRTCVTILAPTLVVLSHVATFATIRGRSMSPALNPSSSSAASDTVLVDRWTPLWSPGSLQRGDIVVAVHPRDPDLVIVKRVRALAGDMVPLHKAAAASSQVTQHAAERVLPPVSVLGAAGRNHDALLAQIDAVGGHKAISNEDDAEWKTVPQGHVWIEGDEPHRGIDSRVFGPVPIGLVIGRVLGVVWPPERFGSPLYRRGNME